MEAVIGFLHLIKMIKMKMKRRGIIGCIGIKIIRNLVAMRMKMKSSLICSNKLMNGKVIKRILKINYRGWKKRETTKKLSKGMVPKYPQAR